MMTKDVKHKSTHWSDSQTMAMTAKKLIGTYLVIIIPIVEKLIITTNCTRLDGFELNNSDLRRTKTVIKLEHR